MSIAWALAVPVIVFITLLGPIWIFFYYITEWKRIKAGQLGDGQVAVEKEELRRMQAVAKSLEDRIGTLETILDAEFPEWRTR